MKPPFTRVRRPLLWRAVEWSAVMTTLSWLFFWVSAYREPSRQRESNVWSRLD